MTIKRRYSEEKDEMDRQTVTMLGVAIDSITKDRVLDQVRDAIDKKGKLIITTPNPEIVLEASSDEILKKSLNDSDIAIADGIGLVLVGNYLKKDIPLHLIKGRELFIDLIELANTYSWKVALLGDRNGSAQSIDHVLSQKYKKVKLYSIEGPNLTKEGIPQEKEDKEIEKRAVSRINDIRPELLFVAFGAPRQEKWVSLWKDRLSVSVIQVVGGTFDSLSGRVPSVPSFWPKSGEWLFRLITQPKRLGRICNAVFVFPWKVLVERR